MHLTSCTTLTVARCPSCFLFVISSGCVGWACRVTGGYGPISHIPELFAVAAPFLGPLVAFILHAISQDTHRRERRNGVAAHRKHKPVRDTLCRLGCTCDARDCEACWLAVRQVRPVGEAATSTSVSPRLNGCYEIAGVVGALFGADAKNRGICLKAIDEKSVQQLPIRHGTELLSSPSPSTVVRCDAQ